MTRTINAPAAVIFELLTDPAKHAAIDGSGSVVSSKAQKVQRLALGSTFGMSMRMGMPYSVTNTVVEFESNQLIAWQHFGGHRWRWELRAVDADTTEVTETFDWSTAKSPKLLELLGFPRRNRRSIEATLTRLATVVNPRPS